MIHQSCSLNLMTQSDYCNLHDDSFQFLKSIIYPTIDPHTPNTLPLNRIRYLPSTTQAPHISRINQTHCNPHVHSSQFLKSIIYPTITPSYTQHRTSQHNQISTIHHSSTSYLTTQSDYCNLHDDSFQFLKSIIYPTIDPHTPNTLPLNTIRYLPSTTQAPHISRINQTHCNPHVHSSQFLKSIIYPTITPSYTQHRTSQHNQISTIHHSSTSYLTNESDSL